MKKLFVSLPMRGKTGEEITAEQEALHARAEIALGEELDLLESFLKGLDETKKNYEARALAESLFLMSDADVVIFAKDWEQARGCRIEHQVCLDYGIDFIESYSE